MALTPEGRALTEAHRRAQQGVRAEFLAQFVALWALLDSTRLDETSPGWVSSVLRLIRPFRERSAQLSTDYFVEFRGLELPAARRSSGPPPQLERSTPASPDRSPGPSRRPSPQPRNQPRATAPQDRRARWDFDESAFTTRPERRTRIEIPDIDWAPSDRAARVSLTVTGPVAQKAKTKAGKAPRLVRDESFVQSSGAASRHVLTGGRQSLLTLLEQDREALAYIRVTDSDPCAFCAMLASRGPVYSSEDAAGRGSNARFIGTGEAKVHDNCACTFEAVYSRNTAWPGRAAEFRELWRDVVGFAPNNRFSGQEAINAFRRAYEQQQRDARRGQVA